MEVDDDAPSEEAPVQISVATAASNKGSVPVWSYPGKIGALHIILSNCFIG